jgi:hypothetical protein
VEGNACKGNHKLKEKGIVDGAIMKFPCYNWITLVIEDLSIAPVPPLQGYVNAIINVYLCNVRIKFKELSETQTQKTMKW